MKIMATFKNIILSALIVFAAIGSGIAQGDIITAAEFMKLVKTDKNLVIIDASKADSYQKTHVKDAVNIPHKSLYNETEIEGLLNSPAELANIFGSNGVSETKTIVVYDGGSQKYSSRVYWILKYLGAPNVKLLHKDMNEWRSSRVPITKMPTKIVKASFTANVNDALIADLAYVKSGKAVIVDNRAPNEFDGSADNSDGHFPGAININHKDLLTDTEAFKSKEELEAIAKKHGLTPDKAIVAYCRTSVRAAVLYAAFVNILGYTNVKVYDGAYLEWVAKGNKLETKAGVAVQKKEKSAASGGGC
jgi:thiosulfate/3-mercaptopyruvate sulfurtransferase